jgi:uncharacterized protein
MNANAINWFEIPTIDFERAKKFYETVLSISMYEMPLGDLKMALFPVDPASGKVGGAIIHHEMYEPRDNGTLIYLNADPDMQSIIDRIEPAGGKIILPRKEIAPDVGFMAVFLDSEGNRLALHSEK